MNYADKVLLFYFLKRSFHKLDAVTVNQMNKFDIGELITQLEDPAIELINPPTKYIYPPKFEVYVHATTFDVTDRIRYIPAAFYVFIGRFLAFLNMDYLNENANYLKVIRIVYQIPRKAVEDVLKYKLFDRIIANFRENNYYVCAFVAQAVLVGVYLLFYDTCDADTLGLLETLISENEDESRLAQQKLIFALREVYFAIDSRATELIEMLYCKFIIGYLIGEPALDEYIARYRINHQYNATIVSSACILCIENLLTQQDLEKYVTALRYQADVRYDCVDYLRSLSRPVIANYVEFFAETYDNFEQFLLLFYFLHCNVNKKQNFNYQIEKLIVQSFIKQFQRMSRYQNFEKPKKTNIYNFIEFVNAFQLEVDCQLYVFLPVLDKFYCADCFIDLSRKILCDNEYIVNELRFPGTSNAEFTASDGMNASVYSVYVSAVILTFNDCIGLIVSNWFIENGRLYRINISQFKELSGVVDTLMSRLYERLVSECGPDMLEQVNQFIEPDYIIRMCTPFSRCVLDSEFDYCKYILHKALDNEQIVQVSAGGHDYQCSSLVIDAIALLSTILREIISNMNFTESGIHSIYSGFSGIVSAICELLGIGDDTNRFARVGDLFEQKSAKYKIARVSIENTDLASDEVASPDISRAFYSNAYAAARYFADVNETFARFHPRPDRSSVFRDFDPRKPAESMYNCFDAIDYFVFRENALEKLRQDLITLFTYLAAFPVVNPRLCDGIVHIFRVSGAETAKNVQNAAGMCDEYLQRIYRYIGDQMDFLGRTMSNYLALGLRAQVKQIYCPTPQTCSFGVILLQVRQMLTHIRQNVCASARNALLAYFCRKLADVHLLVVLDSAHRARTIAKADFPVLSRDFTEIVDLMTKFIDNQVVEQIMQRNLSVVKMHAKDTADLIAACKTYQDAAKRFAQPKNIREVTDAEIALRVLNFRRYCDDDARKYMQALKKYAAE